MSSNVADAARAGRLSRLARGYCLLALLACLALAGCSGADRASKDKEVDAAKGKGDKQQAEKEGKPDPAKAAAELRALQKRARIGCKNLEVAVMAYYTDTGAYPKSLKVLTMPAPGTRKPFIEPKVLVDSWNNPYQYEPQQLNAVGIPLIFSKGDPVSGKKITNWDK